MTHFYFGINFARIIDERVAFLELGGSAVYFVRFPS